MSSGLIGWIRHLSLPLTHHKTVLDRIDWRSWIRFLLLHTRILIWHISPAFYVVLWLMFPMPEVLPFRLGSLIIWNFHFAKLYFIVLDLHLTGKQTLKMVIAVRIGKCDSYRWHQDSKGRFIVGLPFIHVAPDVSVPKKKKRYHFWSMWGRPEKVESRKLVHTCTHQ